LDETYKKVSADNLESYAYPHMKTRVRRLHGAISQNKSFEAACNGDSRLGDYMNMWIQVVYN